MQRNRMEQRQQAYTRRASQHDDLEESRTRHEQFRSSMFSANSRDVAPASRPLSRGGTGSGGGGGSLDSSEDTTAARIDAAIKAAMAVDSTRGANTFNYLNFTPQGSTTSVAEGGNGGGGMNFSSALAPPPQEGGGGGAAAVIPPMPMPGVPVVGGANARGSGGGGGHSSGAYRSYQPSSGTHSQPSTGSMPGLVGMGGNNSSTGHSTGTGYASRAAAAAAAAAAPVDGSVASPILGHRSGSSSGGGSGGGSGCHHISLEKFLEVMTGPGLRVRKHHRAGKGSSGLRVLRYSQEDDSLTWDSHKILGAAQHVLPMADVESVSMQPGNRVVLMCVGGKDSYAVFEAANDDAAAVLYVGLERLRERTQAQAQDSL